MILRFSKSRTMFTIAEAEGGFMNSGRYVSDEYVKFCFTKWLFKFVHIYYRVSPTNAQERFP